MVRKIRLLSVVMYAALPFFGYAVENGKAQPVSYEELGTYLIRTMKTDPAPNNALEKKDEKTSEGNLFSSLQAMLTFKKPAEPQPHNTLHDREKMLLACSLLHKNANNLPEQKISEQAYQPLRDTLKELEVFYDQNESSHSSLCSTLNRTKTTIGYATFAKLLADPNANVDELKKRQAVVKLLTEDKKLFQDLESCVSKIATQENQLFALFTEKNPLEQNHLKNLYFNEKEGLPQTVAKNFNNSPTALTLSNALKNSSYLTLNLALLSWDMIAMGQQTFFYGKVALKNKNRTDQQKEELEEEAHYLLPKSNTFITWAYNSIFTKYWNTGTDYSKALKKKISEGPFYKQSYEDILVYAPGNAWRAGKSLLAIPFSMYYTVKKIKDNHKLLGCLHTELASATTLLQIARHINTLSQKNDTLKNGLFMHHLGIQQLEKKEKEVADLKTLVEQLESATFTNAHSYFSNEGKILATFKKFTELKHEFTGIMQALGEIDAHLGIAKLVNEYKNNPHTTYCFVDYVEQDKPYIHLENFWNPRINPDKAVTNSIELGAKNGPRNAIITGANTSGKSATIKGGIIAALLARLGIAPAQKATMTPFTYIATSMNIADDTAHGNSLFKSEVLRAKNTLENIQQLKPGEHAFLAFDELFVGTDHKTGQKAACKFIEKLNSLENNIFAFATHFKKPTELERTTKGACKNFKVAAYKAKNGTIVRPFKLEEGINTNNIALDILQEEMGSINFLTDLTYNY